VRFASLPDGGPADWYTQGMAGRPRSMPAASELAAEPGWLARILTATASAIIALDLDGHVVFWNAAAERLFGWRAAEVLGRPLPIVPAALRTEWQLQVQRTLQDDDRAAPAAAAETQRLDRDGCLVPVLRAAVPLRDAAGRISGLVETLTDIRAHSQLDEESRALAQLRERELIAMDLHDGLSQSLYSVLLGLAAAERSVGSDGAAGLLAALHQARQHIERVIEELGAYLRDLRAGEVAPPDLAAGLRLLVDGLRLAGGLQARLELDPGAAARLPAGLRGQVLYLVREAVSNVVRHAAASSVTVHLDGAAPTGQLVVRIIDDGRGFDASAGPRAGHHGLRSMAERARLMGGRLSITSQPGQGTTVELVVPLAATAGYACSKP
jgi:PAS domain S-box-containing protein